MTVEELIALLEQCPADGEVRLATQPHYPLAHEVYGVAVPDEDGVPPDDDFDPPEPGIVWILEGRHPDDSPYALRSLWEMARTEA
jgi:hypothetical protein